MTPPPGLSILDAMNDPAVFGPSFEGPSWDHWRALLKAAFALPMTDDDVRFFREVAGDRKPPKHPVRELWLDCGRRAGKNAITSLIVSYLAAMFSRQDRLRPGERATVMCLASDRTQAQIAMRFTRAYFSEIELLRNLLTDPVLDDRGNVVGFGTSSGFELDNGVEVTIQTSSLKAVRGRSILAVVLDECAFWSSDETGTNPDTEIYHALRPGLATLQGMLIGISSPYGKSGLLWKKYKEHYGVDSPDVLFIKAPTHALNPTIDQAIIDEDMAKDPAVARAEWLAEFRDDVSGFLDPTVLDAVIIRGRRELPRVAGETYVAFVDPSGGSSDAMTLGIAHRIRDRDYVVLDLVRERRPPFSPDDVVFEFAATLKSYGLNIVTGDRYAGEWPRERFQVHGITYQPSELTKSDLYRDVLPIINSGSAELLDVPRLTAQFVGLERRVARGGKDSIDHSPGGHDDLANAAAGAMVLALRGNYGAGMGILEYYKRLSEETNAARTVNTVAEVIEHTLSVPLGTSNLSGISGRSYFVTDGTVTVTDYDAKAFLLLPGFSAKPKKADA